MKQKPSIVIAGATGLVGNELVVLIDELKLAHSDIKLLASEDSVGEFYKVADDRVAVEKLREEALSGADLVFLALPPGLAARYAAVAREAGAVVIDTSSQFRLDPSVPLIVAEINASTLTPNDHLIANPSGTVLALCSVLNVVRRAAPLKRAVISTYQACAGAGKVALDELYEQTLAVFNQKDVPHEAFQHQIAFNTIPQIDLVQESGNTREELRLVEETRRILDMPKLGITATAVRIPVFHGDALSLNLELGAALPPAALIEMLSAQPGIQVYAEPDQFPMPIDVVNTDEIHVGRIRQDSSVPYGLNLWIVVDSLRRGTALNALRIAQHLIGIPRA